ncbi:MAG: 4Fe-4S dicluster domain-containing protein [Alphaproteobacteria bacterium]
MQKSLVIDPLLCTGCEQCELACSYSHGEGFNPAKSRIVIYEFGHGEKIVPYTCTQCAEAWCARACPVDALKRNHDTGAIEVLEDVCVGCKVCTIACPFGTVNYNADTGKVAKCDLCGGDPACVDACPTKAITYQSAELTGLDKMRSWAAKL